MVQFFKVKKPSAPAKAPLDVRIIELNGHGMGVARHQGKPLFVAGVLPGEEVRVQLTAQTSRYATASLQKVIKPSPDRLKPFCIHTSDCGGCNLQQLPLVSQRELKQKAVLSLFGRHGMTELPEPEWLVGEGQGYRRAARLAIRRQGKGVALGFRQSQSHELVQVESCGVLAPVLSKLIGPLRQLLNRLCSLRLLGHIELYDAAEGVALLLRHKGNLPAADLDILLAFAQEYALALFLQDDTGRRPLHVPFPLYYQLSNLTLSFTPGDFIQVHGTLNEAMVQQAIDWLAPEPGMPVLDLFCGIGNFSLPLAAAGHPVVGVEGVMEMVEQARGNAEDNQLPQARFYRADLAADFTREPWAEEGFSQVLIDPGRAGAEQVMPYLAKLSPERLLYVSCNPATLARDSEVLLAAGYRISRFGLIDMFPHTPHCEAMALFELT
ncbi:23S rRNA (uracil(1939)-C(5))-methyltransferase RlmD [Oceanimonas baumannii]|uniref:23S rRNA (uracil(1939)-C(5))-methyltransferase RlmD n=1 Tax=Oceanimonas baumannii TaxID=129578 RepID=A0A235CJE5_9GAMM|nr:23S rRNA (uracil(1939)-C(5))-methyltransferase RlmD [Oceanimonas baumannii]OYD24660.1 23S rRNA (uracil(1939)-C(5))-methyltransferase [Oceanimonas baumannii]TDW59404.1 23S rRNA (uracil1939-C5)-methyltransferase [Oceanimonas baumannii]